LTKVSLNTINETMAETKILINYVLLLNIAVLCTILLIFLFHLIDIFKRFEFRKKRFSRKIKEENFYEEPEEELRHEEINVVRSNKTLFPEIDLAEDEEIIAQRIGNEIPTAPVAEGYADFIPVAEDDRQDDE